MSIAQAAEHNQTGSQSNPSAAECYEIKKNGFSCDHHRNIGDFWPASAATNAPSSFMLLLPFSVWCTPTSEYVEKT